MKSVKVNLSARVTLPKYTDAELTWLAERVGLTLDQLRRIHEAAGTTWNAIGYDIIQANDGKDVDRYTVVEVVLDADAISQHGKYYLTPELREWLKTKASKYDLDHVYEAVGANFPFSRYGL